MSDYCEDRRELTGNPNAFEYTVVLPEEVTPKTPKQKKQPVLKLRGGSGLIMAAVLTIAIGLLIVLAANIIGAVALWVQGMYALAVWATPYVMYGLAGISFLAVSAWALQVASDMSGIEQKKVPRTVSITESEARAEVVDNSPLTPEEDAALKAMWLKGEAHKFVRVPVGRS